MKTLIAIVSCLYLQYYSLVKSAVDFAEFGPKLQEMATLLHDTCVEKIKFDQGLIEETRKGNFPEDKDFKDYIACLWLESGIVEANGTDIIVDLDLLQEVMPPKIKNNGGAHFAKTCFDEGKKDERDVSDKLYTVMKCVYKMTPENFVMF